jgi:hypothetical protein
MLAEKMERVGWVAKGISIIVYKTAPLFSFLEFGWVCCVFLRDGQKKEKQGKVVKIDSGSRRRFCVCGKGQARWKGGLYHCV